MLGAEGYDEFAQTSDEEVRALLEAAHRPRPDPETGQ